MENVNPPLFQSLLSQGISLLPRNGNHNTSSTTAPFQSLLSQGISLLPAARVAAEDRYAAAVFQSLLSQGISLLALTR